MFIQAHALISIMSLYVYQWSTWKIMVRPKAKSLKDNSKSYAGGGGIFFLSPVFFI